MQRGALVILRTSNLAVSSAALIGRTSYLRQILRFKSLCQTPKKTFIPKQRPPLMPLIAIKESRRFIRECLIAVGAPITHADAQAAVLAEADYRGHFSHGMNRLEMYINDIKAGTTDGAAVPEILSESESTAWVSGNNGLGSVVGNYCTKIAIKKAKKCGVGWVAANCSNHYGIAAWYTMQCVEQGLIGLSFCNTSPFMTPTRGVKAALGTNPLAFAAPGCNGDIFNLDMATTAVAAGKIEIQRRKGEPLPAGWAQDSEGNVTTDAEIAYEVKSLMPLGGIELNSGYKGFGLGMLVEVLCGILAGSTYGPNIRKWGTSTDVANLGQCFIACNPNCFAPDFESRLSDIMNTIRKMPSVDPEKPILIAGDNERNVMQAVDKAGGVRYVKNQMDTCAKLAKMLKVEPLKPLCK